MSTSGGRALHGPVQVVLGAGPARRMGGLAALGLGDGARGRRRQALTGARVALGAGGQPPGVERRQRGLGRGRREHEEGRLELARRELDLESDELEPEDQRLEPENRRLEPEGSVPEGKRKPRKGKERRLELLGHRKEGAAARKGRGRPAPRMRPRLPRVH